MTPFFRSGDPSRPTHLTHPSGPARARHAVLAAALVLAVAGGAAGCMRFSAAGPLPTPGVSAGPSHAAGRVGGRGAPLGDTVAGRGGHGGTPSPRSSASATASSAEPAKGRGTGRTTVPHPPGTPGAPVTPTAPAGPTGPAAPSGPASTDPTATPTAPGSTDPAPSGAESRRMRRHRRWRY